MPKKPPQADAGTTETIPRNSGDLAAFVAAGAPTRFQPGNPGRQKGTRHKLGSAFVEALHDDFIANGPKVIETVRKEKPDQYLKVIASMLPKELHIKEESLDTLADNEIVELLHAIRALTSTGNHKKAGRGTGETPH